MTSLWTVPGLQQIGSALRVPANQWNTSAFTADGSRVVLLIAGGTIEESTIPWIERLRNLLLRSF